MSVQAKHVELEWHRMLDEETYYPVRDDRRAMAEHGRVRQYRARWVVETRSVRNELTGGQIGMAEEIRRLFRATQDKKRTNFEFVDGGGAMNASEMRRLRKLSEKHELAGYEAVAGAIPNGRRCFHGICEGDSFAEMQRRCGRPRDERYSRELVITVLRALELYAGLNDTDVEAWNAKA